MTNGISLRVDTPGAQPDNKRPESLKDAAGKFEALLISQMLKSARQSDSGGWTGEQDQAGSSIMDMAEQHLGELLGSQGSFGLARMVVNQLGAKE
jgi:Rod binding domain-containing protein